MAQRETGREPFAIYKDALPKDHKLGENSLLSTSVTGQRTSPRGLWICWGADTAVILPADNFKENAV